MQLSSVNEGDLQGKNSSINNRWGDMIAYNMPKLCKLCPECPTQLYIKYENANVTEEAKEKPRKWHHSALG